MNGLFSIIYGLSSFPLTQIFQDGFLNHQTVYPLVICCSLLLKMVIEIVDFPMKKMVIFQFAM